MTRPTTYGETNQPAGSPPTGEPVFLVVGKLRRPHGLGGEMIMEVITDFPERLLSGVEVYVGEDHRPIKIRSRRRYADGLLIAFDGYHDPESAGTLRNNLVYVRSIDRPPLPDGEYYHHQLLGLKVVTDDGHDLGILEQILDTGANEVYVVRPPHGREILLPAIESVILAINLKQGQMLIHAIPGLLSEDSEAG
ncbi:MAG: 16S rRNA processing protein RimM [Anaerolineales bacterium]|nr:16S rRNA processing protein RimM [Anaerolineales bacterium]